MMGVFPPKNRSSLKPFYPKVLICSMSRINSNDTFNNSLLLKNLFAEWPCKNLAQIYSGGCNGDEGFCGQEYQIGPHDRRFGRLFFKLKGEYSDTSLSTFSTEAVRAAVQRSSQLGVFKQLVGRYFMDSGLYELLFKLQPSQQLLEWAEAFDPDIILAQGYNISFNLLPLWLKKRLNTSMAYYCSDDWPSYLYASRDGFCAMTAPLIRQIVERSTKRLFDATDVPFSFNDMMGEEYERRYGKSFTTLMHCDDPDRFKRAESIRLQLPEVKSIVATGTFGESRWPLLIDLEEGCQQLNDMGIPTRATVLTSWITEEGYNRVKSCRFVALRDDPGHELLPSYLKGADLLFLPETFDPGIAKGHRYSISTKAHLFMFSQRPILVYGHPANGLVNYARREGWACVVDTRNIDLLKDSLRSLLLDDAKCQEKVQVANKVVMHNNDCRKVRAMFREKTISFCPKHSK